MWFLLFCRVFCLKELIVLVKRSWESVLVCVVDRIILDISSLGYHVNGHSIGF